MKSNIQKNFETRRGLRRQAPGLVRGPGGPTDDKVGPVMLSDEEYVLPADTVEAVGKENLDKLRLATHDFEKSAQTPQREIPGLSFGGRPFDIPLPGGGRTRKAPFLQRPQGLEPLSFDTNALLRQSPTFQESQESARTGLRGAQQAISGLGQLASQSSALTNNRPFPQAPNFADTLQQLRGTGENPNDSLLFGFRDGGMRRPKKAVGLADGGTPADDPEKRPNKFGLLKNIGRGGLAFDGVSGALTLADAGGDAVQAARNAPPGQRWDAANSAFYETMDRDMPNTGIALGPAYKGLRGDPAQRGPNSGVQLTDSAAARIAAGELGGPRPTPAAAEPQQAPTLPPRDEPRPTPAAAEPQQAPTLPPRDEPQQLPPPMGIFTDGEMFSDEEFPGSQPYTPEYKSFVAPSDVVAKNIADSKRGLRGFSIPGGTGDPRDDRLSYATIGLNGGVSRVNTTRGDLQDSRKRMQADISTRADRSRALRQLAEDRRTAMMDISSLKSGMSKKDRARAITSLNSDFSKRADAIAGRVDARRGNDANRLITERQNRDTLSINERKLQDAKYNDRFNQAIKLKELELTQAKFAQEVGDKNSQRFMTNVGSVVGRLAGEDQERANAMWQTLGGLDPKEYKAIQGLDDFSQQTIMQSILSLQDAVAKATQEGRDPGAAIQQILAGGVIGSLAGLAGRAASGKTAERLSESKDWRMRLIGGVLTHSTKAGAAVGGAAGFATTPSTPPLPPNPVSIPMETDGNGRDVVETTGGIRRRGILDAAMNDYVEISPENLIPAKTLDPYAQIALARRRLIEQQE